MCFAPLWEKQEAPLKPVDLSDTRYAIDATMKRGGTAHFQCVYASMEKKYVILRDTHLPGIVRIHSSPIVDDNGKSMFDTLQDVRAYYLGLEKDPEFSKVTIPDFWRTLEEERIVYNLDPNVDDYHRRQLYTRHTGQKPLPF